MDRTVITETDSDFESRLKYLLAEARDGAITVSNQDGRALHLTVTETHSGLGPPGDKGTGVPLTEAEFRTLIKHIKSVRYGTVVVKIQAGKIIGVEKNEKIKL
jgi:hypothetical protein